MVTEFSIARRVVNRVLRIEVIGEVDMNSSDELATATRTAITTDDLAGIVVDLGKVSFMDSSGIRALLLQQEHAREYGVGYRIENPSPQVRRVLEITGVLTLLSAS
ncbi:STAS domain-containing protein [Phytohabitans kaempferiae]|uniref:Anti-sigma factor antagonist n=1 Tax=Phytohabitans kaempferiae TaxID=1620943 RepID=A0ABV6LYY3_9ACTN